MPGGRGDRSGRGWGLQGALEGLGGAREESERWETPGAGRSVCVCVLAP